MNLPNFPFLDLKPLDHHTENIFKASFIISSVLNEFDDSDPARRSKILISLIFLRLMRIAG